jgi:hypothetical protein
VSGNWWGRTREKWRERGARGSAEDLWSHWERTVVVSFAVLLVAVPTAFAIFPTWTSSLKAGWRILILVCWLAVAFIAVLLAALADDSVRKTVEASQESVEASRRAVLRSEHRAALRDQLAGMFVPGVGGLPEQHHVTLYGVSSDGQFLIPVYPAALD